jgi:hypothetical protein
MNHQNLPQEYSFYYRIIKGGLQPKTIFHRVYHRNSSEAIPALGQKSESVTFMSCLPEGGYRIEIYLYKKMFGFPGDARNLEIPISEPYFSIPINNPKRIEVEVIGKCTIIELVSCGDGSTTVPSPTLCPREKDLCGDVFIDLEDLPLDADDDKKIDPGDNCPVNPNPEQADHDGDGVGDACTPISRILDRWTRFSEWKDFLAQADAAIQLLEKYGLLDAPKVTDPFCMICPPASRESLPLVKSLLTEWKRGRMNERDMLKNLSGILGGPKQTTFNVDILDAGLTVSSRMIHYQVTSRGGGLLVVEIPKALIPAAMGNVKGSYVVSLDKASISVDPLMGEYTITLPIAIPAGKHNVEIRGQ